MVNPVIVKEHRLTMLIVTRPVQKGLFWNGWRHPR